MTRDPRLVISKAARAAAKVAATAVVTLWAGCTIVIPAPDPPKPPVIIMIPGAGNAPPPPTPVPAHVLFVMNLQQSSANLAPSYTALAEMLLAGLQKRGVNVERWAVVPTYPGNQGLQLLLGGDLSGATSGSIPGVDAGTPIYGPPIPASQPHDTAPVPSVPTIIPPGGLPSGTSQQLTPDQITSTLQQLAASGQFDGTDTRSEAEGVVRVGQHLVDATLPPDLGGLDGSAFFDKPSSLFLVIYLQPLARKCAYDSTDCQVDGRSPADIFTDTAADGTATWLHFATGGMPIGEVVHVAIATREGETPDAFRARCGNINSFPKNLLDVMEPSPASYFGPLLAALNAAHPGTGQSADLCDILGEVTGSGTVRPKLGALVNAVANMAGPPPPDTTTSMPTNPGLPIPLTP
jgi:hypothetical protein